MMPYAPADIGRTCQWYFLTSVTQKRLPWFGDPEYAQILQDQILHYATAGNLYLAAWSIMPDHYHLVLALEQSEQLSTFLHGVHGYTATLIYRQLHQIEREKIWQRRTHRIIIPSERIFWQKLAYTLLNPWRANLVDTPLDPYPFSNLKEWNQKFGEEILSPLLISHLKQEEKHDTRETLTTANLQSRGPTPGGSNKNTPGGSLPEDSPIPTPAPGPGQHPSPLRTQTPPPSSRAGVPPPADIDLQSNPTPRRVNDEN